MYNMHTKPYKLLELFVLFVIVPIVFALDVANWIKAALGILGFVYVIIVLLRVYKKKFKVSKNLNWKFFLMQLITKFFVIAVLTALFVWFYYNDNFFIVVIEKTINLVAFCRCL